MWSWIILRVERWLLATVLVLLSGCRTGHEASVVGQIAEIPLGAVLSSKPDEPPDRVVRGSPALVLEERAEGRDHLMWLRILAADGTHGWISGASFPSVSVEIAQNVSASDRSPDDPSPANEMELVGKIRVVGASQRSAVATLSQMLIPAERSWFYTPWLQLEADGVTGWIPPSEITLSWSSGVDVIGMIRPPFTDHLSGLLAFVPKTGETVLRVDEACDEAGLGPVLDGEAWTEVYAVVLRGDTSDDDPSAVLFSGPGTRDLRLKSGAGVTHLLFSSYLPELNRALCEDLDGDGAAECLAEVTLPTGDGYFSTLWVVAHAGSGADRTAAALPIQLDASEGEPSGGATMASWYFDSNRRLLWIWTADGTTNMLSARRYSSRNGLEEVFNKGVGLFLPARDSYDEAAADNIAMTQAALSLMPVSEAGRIRWAAGRLFPEEAEAEAWKMSATFGAMLRMVILE